MAMAAAAAVPVGLTSGLRACRSRFVGSFGCSDTRNCRQKHRFPFWGLLQDRLLMGPAQDGWRMTSRA
jgi:hypothetical protein